MSFIDDFPDDDLVEALGDEISYKRAGKTIELKAFVNKSAERYGEQGVVVAYGINIEILKKQLPWLPQRLDIIKEKNNTYIVDSIIHDDGTYVTVDVHKQAFA
jgi:hypothetical protein